MKPTLSIAIPAYNRATILVENLRELLPELIETGVTVHVSDDSTDDLTQRGIAELRREYAGIHYHPNRPSLGHDRNCLRTLSLPDADYVWYLADAQRIASGGLRRVLAALERTPSDVAVVNATGRGSIDLPPGLHRDPALILERLAWHMTMTGASIYSRALLEDVEERFAKYVGTNFVQLGIILEGLLTARRGLLWMDDRLTSEHPGKPPSYWNTRVFEVFARDWSQFVLRLPESYPNASKLFAIREHSARTGLLEWPSLVRFRRRGVLTRDQLRLHRDHIRLASGVPLPAVALLSVWPRFAANVLAPRLVTRMLERRKERGALRRGLPRPADAP